MVLPFLFVWVVISAETVEKGSVSGYIF